jgi:hypothetical protein
MKKVLFITLFLSQILFSQESAIDHAPIGVMADHFHSENEVMISFRQSLMYMEGNILDGNSIQDNEIIEIPHSLSSSPSNLSVVPQDMQMSMSMLGLMYAPSDRLTLMGMAMFMNNSMQLNTYQPMMDRDLIGSFDTNSGGLSSLGIGGLIPIHSNDNSRLHVHVGLEKSSTENQAKGEILTPMNMQMEMILPYGMQIGDGALRFSGSLTYVIKPDSNSVIGIQGFIRKSLKEEEWAFGDQRILNAWYQKSYSQDLSWSTRLEARNQDKISGSNPLITQPIQTAYPHNYGGTSLNLSIGLNKVVSFLPGRHPERIGIEFTIPVYQNKNGIQMKDECNLILGIQKEI